MICKKCNKYETTTKNECKICSFKKRRKQDIDNILSNKMWDMEELEIILYNILYNKISCINELLPKLKNKTLDSLVDLLSNELTIRGQCSIKVKIQCDVCGKEYLVNLSKYKSELHNYCSMECRNKGFMIFGSHKGENNSRYNSEKVNCTNCGKEFYLPKAERNKTNKYGDSHHFCCQECYWEYRSKYYIKDKNFNYHRNFSKSQRDLMRKNMVKRLSEGSIPQTQTQPHLKINKILDNMNEEYINEKNMKYYSVDIFLCKYNLIIEIMGDYWHGSPIHYNYLQLSDIQKKDIKQDKSKHTYIKKYHNIEILYLWEYDIKNNIELCQNLIKEYINKKGVLNNYQSFNYHLEDNVLYLNNDIIKPYFIK